jgi:hypothetical protein
MKRTIALAFAVFFAIAVGAAYAVVTAKPTLEELDGDLKIVKEEIAKTEARRERFGDGLIATQIEFEHAVLKTSEAMLSMKRSSLLRMISLNFTIEGQPVQLATQEELDEIRMDMKSLTEKIVETETKSARYSGGLIKVTLEMALASQHATAALLQQRYLSAKYGLSLPRMSGNEESGKQPAKPVGEVVPDKDAL